MSIGFGLRLASDRCFSPFPLALVLLEFVRALLHCRNVLGMGIHPQLPETGVRRKPGAYDAASISNWEMYSAVVGFF